MYPGKYLGTTTETPEERMNRSTKREFSGAEKTDRQAPVQPRVTVAVSRKLMRPYIKYLNELAMDIDPALKELPPTELKKTIEQLRKRIKDLRDGKGLIAEERAGSALRLAHLCFLTGRFPEAFEAYSLTLEMAGAKGDRRAEAIALRNIAAVSIAAGDYDKGRNFNEKSLALLEENADEVGLQMALNNQGALEKYAGRVRAAKREFEKAKDGTKGNNRFRILALTNLANLCRSQGRYAQALDYYREALDTAVKISDARLQSEINLGIGKVYADWGKTDEAIKYTEQSMLILAGLGAPLDVAKKLIGDLYLDSGQAPMAEQYLRDADFDSSLGRLELAQGQPDKAVKRYEQLLNAAQKEGNQDELFVAYTGLARSHELLKNYAKSEEYYQKAMNLTEELRSNLLLSERKGFFAFRIGGFSRLEPAKGLIRVSLKLKKAGQSVTAGEAIRARGFADDISERVDIRNFNVPDDISEQEVRVTAKLASLKQALTVVPKSLDAERCADISKQINAAESERNKFVQNLWRDFKDYAAAKYPRPCKLEDSLLGQGEYLIVYDVLDDGVAIRLLQGKKILDSSFVDWKVDQLESAAHGFRQSFETATLDKFDQDLAKLLYDRLLAGILKNVPQGKPVVIIPDGVLAILPFEALVVSDKPASNTDDSGASTKGLIYLGDLYPLSYYQSITSLTLARSLKSKQKVGLRTMVVADPVFDEEDPRLKNAADQERQKLMEALPENLMAIQSETCATFRRLCRTAELAETLEKLSPGKTDVFTGLQANKSLLFDKPLTDYGSIVFATHGYFGKDIPGVQEPVLAMTAMNQSTGQDGFLRMTEVMSMKLNADVVALTACQTGLGANRSGDGVMSMGRAFQCAGARSVIMSLSPVDEGSSVTLMSEFFKRRKVGANNAQAWAGARRAIRSQGYDHPFYWGSFILVGEYD
jgi:CHAT domain-containing protein